MRRRGGVRASWLAAAAALLALVVPVLAPRLSSEGSVVADQSTGLTREDMQRLDAEHRDAPLVLPVRLPTDYGWAGLGERQGDGRRVWARVSQFASVDGRPLIEICARVAENASGCERGDGPSVERRAGSLVVVITSPSDAATSRDLTAFWSTVPLTVDFSEVTWLT